MQQRLYAAAVFRSTCNYNFSASSIAEFNRLALMPMLTAASVSLACFAASTLSRSRVTSVRATANARSRLVAFPVSRVDSVAADTIEQATPERPHSATDD